MLYKYGNPMRNFWAFSFLHFGGVFNKTIIPLALVGCEIITVYSSSRRKSNGTVLSPLCMFILTILQSLHQLSKQRTLH